MIAILTFLVRYCSKLFEKPGFKFKDSEVGRNAFEGSCVRLESDDMEVFISNEREEMLFQIRSKYDTVEDNWFSFDLLARLLGYEAPSAVMRAKNSDWLAKNLDAIINRFGKEEITVTLAKLNHLKDERTKRL